MAGYVLSLDQGTTSSRALLFDNQLQVVAIAQKPFQQIYPRPGLVEHDPLEILETTIACARNVVANAAIDPAEVAAVGITNQRETIVVWEKESGRPLYNAIVWQDRRTSGLCQQLEDDGNGEMIALKTGLLLDPYFSASKLNWVLNEIEGAGALARAGKLCFGTIDSWLIWNLTGGKSHKTDATNASRTMLYNIKKGVWDEDLLGLFDVPPALLPEVMDCAGVFGELVPDIIESRPPILGVAGDQHAALIGQACFQPGEMKSTYGTGCFALLNTGEEPVVSTSRLLTTVAYQIKGARTFALEGSIFIAGAAVQWLQDEVGLIQEASDCDDLARQSDLFDPVCLVPAFTGLGAPYWQADVRGALLNLSRGTGRSEIVRAALESVGFQTLDLYKAMANDWSGLQDSACVLRVDGGMSRSDWAMQFLSDMLNCPIERPAMTETTALGAALLAGSEVSLYPSFDEFANGWRFEKRFEPIISDEVRVRKSEIWRKAVGGLLS